MFLAFGVDGGIFKVASYNSIWRVRSKPRANIDGRAFSVFGSVMVVGDASWANATT